MATASPQTAKGGSTPQPPVKTKPQAPIYTDYASI